jgi:hypothetical protein
MSQEPSKPPSDDSRSATLSPSKPPSEDSRSATLSLSPSRSRTLSLPPPSETESSILGGHTVTVLMCTRFIGNHVLQMLKGNPWLYYKTREGAEEALQEQRANNDQCSSTDAVLTTGEHHLPYLRVYDRTQDASTCWWLEDVPRGLNMEEKTRKGFFGQGVGESREDEDREVYRWRAC